MFKNTKKEKKVEVASSTIRETTTTTTFRQTEQSSYLSVSTPLTSNNHLRSPTPGLNLQPQLQGKSKTPALQIATDAKPFKYPPSTSNSNNLPFTRPSYPVLSNSSFPSRQYSSFRDTSPLFPTNSPLRKYSIPSTSGSVSNTAEISRSLPSINSNGIPTYNTKGKKRGKVLIINNILFEDKDERKGAKHDSKSLEKLFNGLKFSVTTRKDLKKSGMEKEIKLFASDTSLKDYNMSILIVMSHGTNMKDSKGTITQISGVDNKLLWVNDILNIFANEKYKHLIGKPKIFIFQCCRGDAELHTDANPIQNASSYSDMLVAYSTLPGHVSYRTPDSGSWYIQKLCETFSKHALEWDIETMLKIVDAELSKIDREKKQIACYESRGFKRCFLIQE